MQRSIQGAVMIGLMGAAAWAMAAPDAATVPFHLAPADDAWRAALPRDAVAATQAYLDRIPPDVKARADAYFEGGYWLLLWNWLLGLAVSLVLLGGRRFARVRDWAQRVGRVAVVRDALVGAVFAAASWTLSLPLTVYQGFWRELAYGMATQNFGAWFVEQLMSLAVAVIATGLVVALVYAVLRRTGERWWLWGAAALTGVMMLIMLVAPVWIDPLFNTYKPVENGPVRDAVLALARANGVPVDNVYEFDASRQTTRISANVSGIFGSAAVRLNDNLLRRTSLPEIRSVMAHELGHYVLNHVYKMLTAFALLLLVIFAAMQWAMTRLLARHGERWGLRGAADVAGLPLLVALFSTAMLLATPITNTITREQEIEADRFALNLAREPHGEAEVDLKLTEYRKPDPGPIEEFLFFDHPSTRFRVHDAMRWREAMGTAP